MTLLLAVVCAAVFGGGLNAGPVQAQDSTQPAQRLGQQLSAQRADSLAAKADLTSVSKSGEEIDTSSAQAWELDDGNVYVNYSFASDVEGVSNIGAVVSPDGDVLATAEIVMKATSENSGHVEAWNNGAKTADREVTSDDASSGKLSPQADGFWSKLNDCLSSAGISSWVVAGISVACGAVCVGTAGLGCVACIAAAAGVTGGTAGYCIDQAQK
ncbi:hypothetical protein ACH82I_09390 [Brevibacterium sp. GP-SGM9]|uniref:hypothetical protein n=1 Tax=unclassified Brevibacterium TaxID=2614124 RepID=UPI001E556613|nr:MULTISPECIES: hypothetical protein [unclassified Brevibacterium]MCD1286030.1 hypothetical protein [Brevibacterium sp. CCUG 69071]MDK8433381.1 hypothetical protein [Brevibacterium sp. H-BE7]